MSDETTVQESQVDTEIDESAPVEAADTEDLVDFGDGEMLTIIGTTVKKGRGKGRLAYYIKPVPDYPTLFAKLRKIVGEQNWDKCVYAEMVRKACNDATLQAINEAEDGKPSDAGFVKAYKEWHIPSTRRTGVHIKDLREKAAEIFAELNPLLLRHFQYKPGEDGALSEDEHSRMIQLSMEFADLNVKIEEKTRKGTGKGKKAAKK